MPAGIRARLLPRRHRPPPQPPAATIYVDQANASCSNTGSGSAAQPFCTISAAASNVVAGQTVQVAARHLSGACRCLGLGFANAPITFVAAPGATVTVTGQANGFYISGKNWITVSGFTVTGTTDHGLYVSSGSSHITLANNHVSGSGDTAPGKTKSGIYFSNVSDSLIVGNTSDHNSSYGIYLTSGSTRNVVDGNSSFSNAMGYQRAASGIRLYSSPGNTISNNLSHDNEDSGIEFDTNADGNLTFNNVVYNNGDHGIDDYKSTGQTIVANTVYKNVTAGINIEGNSTGATIANNISVDNGIKSPRTHSNIRVESGSTSGTTLDYDLVYLTTADTLLIWNSVSYTSLAAFRSASGQETHAIQADPRWTNVAGGNFHLTTGSPAIDSANAGIAGATERGRRRHTAHRRSHHPEHRCRDSSLRRPRRVRIQCPQHRPRRYQPIDLDHGGRGFQDLHGSGLRRLRQPGRRRHRLHDVLDRPGRLVYGQCLYGHQSGGTYGHRERRRQDEHGVIERDRGTT